MLSIVQLRCRVGKVALQVKNSPKVLTVKFELILGLNSYDLSSFKKKYLINNI